MIKRKPMILAAVLGLGLFLGACAKNKESAESQPAPDVASSPAPPPAAPAETTPASPAGPDQGATPAPEKPPDDMNKAPAK